MRKSRFLCMLCVLLLLLFCIVASGCQGEEPPASEPPAEPPTEEQPPEKEPLVIEQGEIVVSDYWQNDPVAVNPRPERVEGTPLCFEEIAYVGADLISVKCSTKRFFVADNLSGASELIIKYVSDQTRGFDTVCEAVSHVDFSQFRLLLFLDVYGSGSLTHHYKMEGLVHDGEGKLTKMMLDPADPGWVNHMMAYMARFVLVRRADYEAEGEAAQGIDHYYRPYPDPIEPGEINVSPYWQNATPAENPCPDVAGSSIPFEELGCYCVYDSFWLKKPATLYCVTDLADAATLIDGYVYDHGEDDVVALREKASQIDFSQFYLLVMIERYAYDLHYLVPKALVHDGSGDLTLVVFEDAALRPSYATEGEYAYARFVLVRRADYAASDNAEFTTHVYADPPNVIEQGEIAVSEHWDVIEHPINYYKHFCNAPALQFEQLGMVAVEYNGRKRIALADDIAEAAALIDSITTYNSVGCLALNEIASHVDFSQFRLLLIEENWYNTDRIDNCYLDTIIYKDKNLHTVYGYYDNSGPDPGSGSGMRYVRVILIHRSQLSEDPEFYQRHN